MGNDIVDTVSIDLELQQAQNAVATMMTLGDFGDYGKFLVAWQNFLHRIERVWNKANIVFENVKGHQALRSTYGEKRKNDPLLQFLKQARHAGEHSTQEAVQHIDGKIDIRSTDTKPIFNRMRTAKKDPHAFFVGEQLDFSSIPPQKTLMSVNNRNQLYNPPRQHLGHKLGSSNPVEIAQMGLAFYSAYVESLKNLL